MSDNEDNKDNRDARCSSVGMKLEAFTPVRVLPRSPVEELMKSKRRRSNSTPDKTEKVKMDRGVKWKRSQELINGRIKAIKISLTRENQSGKLSLTRDLQTAGLQAIKEIVKEVSKMEEKGRELEEEISEMKQQNKIDIEELRKVLKEKTLETEKVRLELKIEREKSSEVYENVNLKMLRQEIRKYRNENERAIHELKMEIKQLQVHDTNIQNKTKTPLNSRRNTKTVKKRKQRHRKEHTDMEDTEQDIGVDSNEEVSEQESEQDKEEEANTYAEAIRGGNRKKKRWTKGGPSWKTPDTKPEGRTIIRLKNNQDTKQTMEKLRTTLQGENKEVIKKIIQTRTGAVIMETSGGKGTKNLNKKLKETGQFVIKTVDRQNPRIIIERVQKGYTRENVKEILFLENEELTEKIDDKEQIEIVINKPGGYATEDWIVKLRPEIFRRVMKKGYLIFDLVKKEIREHVDVAICYNCCAFGHVSKYCKKRSCMLQMQW